MAIGNVLEPSHMYDFTAFTGAQTLPNAPIDSPIPCRGVTIHNNDSICIAICGCRCDSRLILVHLRRHDQIQFSDLISIQ